MKNIERAAEFVLLMDKQLKNQLFVVNGEVQRKNWIKEMRAINSRSATIFVQWCIRCCPPAHSGAD